MKSGNLRFALICVHSRLKKQKSTSSSKLESANMKNEILSLLRCPVSQSSLAVADADLVAELNQKIEAGELTNRLGQAIDLPLESGLVNEGRTLLFAVRGEIMVLVADQAIELSPSAS